jgi:pimeloyl-ACP methyl ester carboxylesterase
MSTVRDLRQHRDDPGGNERARLLAGVPAGERRLDLAGISTAVLEGGDGTPIVLLHGPGESAVRWKWIIPGLVRDFHVVAPDLPAHGGSDAGAAPLDRGRVLTWLGGLIERTCPTPPVLVGHVLGGAIAARFAVESGDHLRQLVLVDALGLAPFRPAPRFALGLLGFQIRPNGRSYTRFMRQCAFDLDAVRNRMGEDWEPFVAYNLQLARTDGARAAGRLFREVGLPRIPPEDLQRIGVSTALIWGRHDRALPLRIAEDASRRYAWPLHVIDDVADDPARDRPEAFLAALRDILTDQSRL